MRAKTFAWSGALSPSPALGGRSHLVILPSYNSGHLLRQTILTVLEKWKPVWVVLDGSTDSSVAEAHDLQRDHSELRLFLLPQNHGKGGAALVAMKAALEAGFSHALHGCGRTAFRRSRRPLHRDFHGAP